MLSFPEQSSVFAANRDQLLESFKQLETLLPTIIPSVFSEARKIQGDGGAGTVVEFVYAPEFADGRTMKMTTDVFDEVNHIFHFDFHLEGDSRYSSFKLHIQLVPGILEGTTRSQWRFFYEPDNAPPPLDIIAAAHPRIIALSTFLQEFRTNSSSNAEPVECFADPISSVSSEVVESLTAPTPCTENLTERAPSVCIELAESLAGTFPSESTKPVENRAETICVEAILTM